MITEARDYVLDACQDFMKEAGVTTLPWVPTPSVEDKFEPALAKKGIFAGSAASHLMKLLYVARLVHGDFLVATTFLARRIHFWSLNEDRRLKRLFAYAYHHLSESLAHQFHPSDRAAAFLD